MVVVYWQCQAQRVNMWLGSHVVTRVARSHKFPTEVNSRLCNWVHNNLTGSPSCNWAADLRLPKLQVHWQETRWWCSEESICRRPFVPHFLCHDLALLLEPSAAGHMSALPSPLQDTSNTQLQGSNTKEGWCAVYNLVCCHLVLFYFIRYHPHWHLSYLTSPRGVLCCWQCYICLKLGKHWVLVDPLCLLLRESSTLVLKAHSQLWAVWRGQSYLIAQDSTCDLWITQVKVEVTPVDPGDHQAINFHL